MCAVYPVCLPSCVLAGALPGLGLTSPSYLKILFNRIIKPLTPGGIGVYKLLVYFLRSFDYEYFKNCFTVTLISGLNCRPPAKVECVLPRPFFHLKMDGSGSP